MNAASQVVAAFNFAPPQMDDSKKPADTNEEGVDEVKIVYDYPDPQTPVFTNHMVVQRIEHEYVIGFYQLLPPPDLRGSPAERKACIEATASGGVHAKCVAKISVSTGRMPSFIQALVGSFARAQAKTAAEAQQATGSKKEE